MEQYKIIHDEEEMKWFFDNVMPELLPHEVYFLSLSARNKYLTMEEREEIGLGRTEMFNRVIVKERSWESFIRTVRRMECDTRGFTTRKNLPIPSKTIICYFNINPTNTIKAWGEFQDKMNTYSQELIMCAMNGNNADIAVKEITRMDSHLMTCMQKSSGTRHWVDFDFDVPKVYDTNSVSEFLESKGITHYYWIDTKSGFHLLVNKSQLKFNPKEIIDFALSLVPNHWGRDGLEIIQNKNNMIPLPGTYQAGHLVKVLNKESRG